LVWNCGGVLKKAQFLGIAVVAAVLVLAATFSLSFDDVRVQVDYSIVGNAVRVVEDTPLPKLSESAA
jgi:hypothetical protein